VRFRVQVPARLDLHAGLQVRGLTENASRPGRSSSGPGAANQNDDRSGATMNRIANTLATTLLMALSLGVRSVNASPPSESSLHTEGKGPVTVVFEAGLGDQGKVWSSVQSSVARSCARTVSYTRSGYGSGSSAEGPRDAEHIVAELRQRLAESGMAPPYVLVGHSLGGLYMQYFARRYPSDVQGMVLVDSTHWDQLDRIKVAAPGTYRMIKTASYLMSGTMRREFADIPSAGAEVKALPRAQNVPTIVLSSTRAAMGETAAFRTLAAQLQNEIAAASAVRRHDFVVDSGHYIQNDQPQAVISAARELAGCDTGQ
jgi:pimeloyl-ACP methyl ester carboxylesterase